jgi:hypothetical protein
MPMFKRGCVVLLVILAAGCSSSATNPTPLPVTPNPTPTPTPPPVAPAKYAISGLLTDGTSGGILPGINIQLLDGQNAGQSTMTDSTGRYAISGVLAGTMTLSASATSYQTATRSITVSGDTTVNIVLPRASTPTPTPTPTPPPGGGPTYQPTNPGTWSVTIQTLSDSGPSFCIHQPAIGSTFQSSYLLYWSDDTVMFVPPDPIDWDSFTAKVSGGLNFTGANPPTGSGKGMCAHYVQASSITGSFAPDRKSFTATVTWSFTLDSGQTETITFSWAGTRQE